MNLSATPACLINKNVLILDYVQDVYGDGVEHKSIYKEMGNYVRRAHGRLYGGKKDNETSGTAGNNSNRGGRDGNASGRGCSKGGGKTSGRGSGRGCNNNGGDQI